MKKLLILIAFAFNLGISQKAQIKKADKNFDNFAYVNTIEVYEKILQNGYQSAELYEKLGNSYYLNAEYNKAAACYKSLIGYGEPSDNEIYFRYSHCLKALNQYDEANKMLQKYYEKEGKPEVRNQLGSYLDDIKNNSKVYTVKPTKISTTFTDYSPQYYKNQLYYTSAMDSVSVTKKTHKWTGENYTDIFVATVNADSSLTYKSNFSDKINSKFNESSPIFAPDGNTIYFTRNNFLNGRRGKSDDKSTFVKIYKATLKDGNWDNITPLPFNNDEYSFAHPAISPDGKYLYYASDNAGGMGKSDIYRVKIDGNGSFGEPENLGKLFNTEGRESFPSIDKSGNLYYASDGILGFGGFDLFMAKKNEQGSFDKPVNLGQYINSAFDDFSMTFIDDLSGYFSSNREGGQGKDDIYFFRQHLCKQIANGIVFDAQTNNILPGATVILFDENMNEVAKKTVGNDAMYEFEIDCNKKYYIRGLKDQYEPYEVKFTSTNEFKKINKNDLFLSKKEIPVDVGTDLAKLFNISKIYFDLDKWNIRPDAEVHLQKVIEVMKKYPAMTIDIRSHTDSRQTHRYNEILSDRRAKSTLEYMVKNGIARNRLTAKGYGENQLVNKCADDVPCTEEEHQMNRRSEFIITKID